MDRTGRGFLIWAGRIARHLDEKRRRVLDAVEAGLAGVLPPPAACALRVRCREVPPSRHPGR